MLSVRDRELLEAAQAADNERQREAAIKAIAERKRMYAEGNAAFREQEAAAERVKEAAKEEQFRLSILHSFVESGGEAKDFAYEWPKLRMEIVRQRTLGAAVVDNSPAGIAKRTLEQLYPRKATGAK
jgi:hypothetical protein